MFKKIAGVIVALAPLSSFAAVPQAITDAVGNMGADGVTIATAIVVAFYAVFAIKFLWRSK